MIRLVLNVRNTRSNVLTISAAQCFVAGVMQTTIGCGGTLGPGILCSAMVTISGVTTTTGIVYRVKIVLSDGAMFATSVIAGQVTRQTGVP